MQTPKQYRWLEIQPTPREESRCLVTIPWRRVPPPHHTTPSGDAENHQKSSQVSPPFLQQQKQPVLKANTIQNVTWWLTSEVSTLTGPKQEDWQETWDDQRQVGEPVSKQTNKQKCQHEKAKIDSSISTFSTCSTLSNKHPIHRRHFSRQSEIRFYACTRTSQLPF